MRPGVQELLLWLNRRHIDALNMQMLVQPSSRRLLDAGVEIAREQPYPAIAFLDLSGFTRLTDDAGDELAVARASRLSDVVRTTALRFHGIAVKMLGDGVMFHFPDPADAVRCAFYLLPEVARQESAGAGGGARRSGRVPKWRLLRADGEPGLQDHRLRSSERGPGFTVGPRVGRRHRRRTIPPRSAP